MIRILEITDEIKKYNICIDILTKLPEWFSIPKYIKEYGEVCQSSVFFVASDNDKPIGFVSLKSDTPKIAEIYVCGILKKYHRHGIGRQMQRYSEEYCKSKGIETMIVKTLDESVSDPYYEKTRKFYLAMGFNKLKILYNCWDENNPCLVMFKKLT